MFRLSNLKGKPLLGMYYQSQLLPYSNNMKKEGIPFLHSRGQRISKRGKEEIMIESSDGKNSYHDIQELLMKKK